MLLTRSRLGPGPKPGSSLHLHVLGTPPAFVLSQDQTLREELHKESSGISITVIDGETCSPPAAIKSRVRPWWDADPCATTWTLQVHRERPAQDGVNLGTVVSCDPEGSPWATASNLDTQSRSRNRSKSVHAVEFSKTVAPLRKGFLFRDASGASLTGSRPDR